MISSRKSYTISFEFPIELDKDVIVLAASFYDLKNALEDQMPKK